MRFVSTCSKCNAKSGMHPIQEKGPNGGLVTVLRGTCVICGNKLDEKNGGYIPGPRGVEEPEPDLLEIL